MVILTHFPLEPLNSIANNSPKHTKTISKTTYSENR